VIERMTGMSASLQVLMRCFRTGLIVDASRILTRKVWRENRMDGAAVNMTGIPMAMVGLGMHVDKRERNHPQHYPCGNTGPKQRCLLEDT